MKMVFKAAAAAALVLNGCSSILFASEQGELINGREAKRGEFPELVYLNFGRSRCSGTLVGDQAVLTAAHCGETNQVASFQFEQKQYKAVCTRAKDYPKRDVDLLLCKIDRPIKAPYATVVTKPLAVGDAVTITGYGCTRSDGSGGNDGILRVGNSVVTRIEANDTYTQKDDGGILCFGDSGGGSFEYMAEPAGQHHYLIGVNSKGDIKKLSLLSRVDTAPALEFFDEWTAKHKVGICGVNMVCDDSKPKPDPKPRPDPRDCQSELFKVEATVRELKECLSNG